MQPRNSRTQDPNLSIFAYMTRLYAIVLLSIFALDVTAVFFVFKVQQFQIRKEVKRQIKRGVPEEELFKITVTSENRHLLNWRKDHEFQLDGQLFDVVRSEQPDEDTTLYFCISDQQETVLFANLDELLRKNNDPLKRTGKTLQIFLKLFSNFYFQPFKGGEACFDVSPRPKPWKFSTPYSAPFINILSPPPKAV